MKKRIVTLLLPIVILLSFTSVNWAGDFTFRKTNWGMSRSDVKASESLNVEDEDNEFIGYSTKVLGKNVHIMYFFDDNKLIKAWYVLNEHHTDDNGYIKDHEIFKLNLREKYGEPKEEAITKKDMPRWALTDPEPEYRLIREGYEEIHSQWKTPSTRITLMLRSNADKNKIMSIISYECLPDL